MKSTPICGQAFNTKKVRLKRFGLWPSKLRSSPFNTKKVRLKRKSREIHADLRASFQYQKGAIKTLGLHIPGELQHAFNTKKVRLKRVQFHACGRIYTPLNIKKVRLKNSMFHNLAEKYDTFNTKKVRLKPANLAYAEREVRRAFQYQKGAIKTRSCARTGSALHPFQYQKGAIKTLFIREEPEKSGKYFNTKKVRLKQPSRILTTNTPTYFNTKKVRLKPANLAYAEREVRRAFQYQKGAIKTRSCARTGSALHPFQYQKGAIKTLFIREEPEKSGKYFNTKKVRLKQPSRILTTNTPTYFNTKKVRLKLRRLLRAG